MCIKPSVVFTVHALPKSEPEGCNLNKDKTIIDVTFGRIRKEFLLVFVSDYIVNEVY